MPKRYVCPFYLFDKKDRVKCENESQRFKSAEEKKSFVNTFCCCERNWKNCINAMYLLNYYEKKK